MQALQPSLEESVVCYKDLRTLLATISAVSARASVLALAVVFVAVGLGGCGMGDYEEPQYRVVVGDGDIEVRDYRPMLVAEVVTRGEREEAIRAGFRLLADYIFGNNVAKSSIDMTAPVTQQASQEIAMTAPVTQQAKSANMAGGAGEWLVRFVMPSEYTLTSIPKPVNKAVMLSEVPSQRFAVIRFAGRMTQDNLGEHEQELRDYLAQRDMEALAPPVWAFYNPPWTLPFMRRNEVLIEIKQ